MLQNIRDKITGWFAALFLGAIAVVFVFWGIRFESSVHTYAAKVNGESIPVELVRRAWQDRQSQLQQQLRAEIPPDVARAEKDRLLDEFISRELLVQHVHELGYRVSDTQLADTLFQIPALQVDGKFSRDRYAALLRQQGRTEPEFEREFRRDLETQQLRSSILVSAFVTPGELRRLVELQDETRDVDYAVLPAASYADKVAVTPQEVADWYAKHKSDYMTPETVALQYVELKLEDVAAGVQVTDDALHKYYDQVAAERFVEPERRRASHILIEAGNDDAAALKKAEDIAARARAGEDFAKLAHEYSADPGSKDAGGDLGWATRDAFVKPFADALFGMQKGEIRGPVKTQFGYHIIRLDDVQPQRQRSFDEVRTQLESDYRRDQAQSIFYDKSQQLADESFAALTELDSVAKKLGLEVQTVDGFTREKGGGPFGADPKVIAAVFSNDVLQDRQNSQPIQLGNDKVVVLRVTDHKTPQQRSLEDAKADIEASLQQQKERKAALDAATAAAARVSAGETLAAVAAADGVKPAGQQTLNRTSDSVPAELLKAAFVAPRPAGPGKVYAGTATLANGDAAVFVVSAVKPGAPPTGADAGLQLANRAEQGARTVASAEFAAYMAELLRTANIKKNPAALE